MLLIQIVYQQNKSHTSNQMLDQIIAIVQKHNSYNSKTQQRHIVLCHMLNRKQTSNCFGFGIFRSCTIYRLHFRKQNTYLLRNTYKKKMQYQMILDTNQYYNQCIERFLYLILFVIYNILHYMMTKKNRNLHSNWLNIANFRNLNIHDSGQKKVMQRHISHCCRWTKHYIQRKTICMYYHHTQNILHCLSMIQHQIDIVNWNTSTKWYTTYLNRQNYIDHCHNQDNAISNRSKQILIMVFLKHYSLQKPLIVLTS